MDQFVGDQMHAKDITVFLCAAYFELTQGTTLYLLEISYDFYCLIQSSTLSA
jgi:hypothetical protein